MKDKKIYIILIISILLTLVGISLAYFSLKVVGNENAKINKVVTGKLELTYTDASEISLNNAMPGNTIEKVIKVTNTGTKEVSYNIGWTDYINEITNNELVIEGSCKNLNSSNTEEGTCNGFTTKAITGSNILSNISIEPNITHEYTLKITFKETNKPQNYNKNKSFSGKINITESTAKTVYCTFDGELTQGAEYVNGQYTYRYMQEGNSSSTLSWKNITTDGWGVQLTDKSSTGPVTSKVCTYINNKPVISMSYMFYDSKATSIDLSSFNTSNVTNMHQMFYNSPATALDLSSFNTSNVTNMSQIFFKSQATALDLSSFNTSNVTDMKGMFTNSKATSIDLSSFDTSNVTNMFWMFSGNQATTLDLSNFDTSKVTNMSNMFRSATNLKTIYASEKFVTTNVESSGMMFDSSTKLVGGAGTVYDKNHVTGLYARIDGGTDLPGYFTAK